MAGVIVNEGRQQIAAALLAWLDTCHVLLWTGSHVPVAGDTLATYTAVEATYGGYARQATPSWSSSGIDTNGNELMIHPTLTFVATGSGLPQTVTGYVLTDPTQTYCIAAEQAAVPMVFTTAGQALAVVPQFYFGGLTPPY